MQKKMVTSEDLTDREMVLDHLTKDYLTERGWKLSCENPASLWLWEKSPYKGVSTDVAVRFERNIESGDRLWR